MDFSSRVAIGDEAQDIVTGFKGIVAGVTFWLNGCVRIYIQPQELKDGKPIAGESFDIEQVKVITVGKLKPKPAITHTMELVTSETVTKSEKAETIAKTRADESGRLGMARAEKEGWKEHEKAKKSGRYAGAGSGGPMPTPTRR